MENLSPTVFMVQTFLSRKTSDFSLPNMISDMRHGCSIRRLFHIDRRVEDPRRASRLPVSKSNVHLRTARTITAAEVLWSSTSVQLRWKSDCTKWTINAKRSEARFALTMCPSLCTGFLSKLLVRCWTVIYHSMGMCHMAPKNASE